MIAGSLCVLEGVHGHHGIVFVEVDGIDVIEGGASRTVPRLDKIVSAIHRQASAVN